MASYFTTAAPREKSGFEKFIGVVGGLVGLVAAGLGLVTTGNAIADNEHTIRRERVVAFVHNDYFPDAIADPEWTRTHLTTPDFQALPGGKKKPYNSWWKKVETVPDESIALGPSTDVKNSFTLGWTWVMKDGRVSDTEVEAKFACASFFESYVPFMTCSEHNIRLQDTRRIKG